MAAALRNAAKAGYRRRTKKREKRAVEWQRVTGDVVPWWRTDGIRRRHAPPQAMAVQVEAEVALAVVRAVVRAAVQVVAQVMALADRPQKAAARAAAILGAVSRLRRASPANRAAHRLDASMAC